MTETFTPSPQHRGYAGYGNPYTRPVSPQPAAFPPAGPARTAGRSHVRPWAPAAGPGAFQHPASAIAPPPARPWGPPNAWAGPGLGPMPPTPLGKRKVQWWAIGAAGVAAVAVLAVSTLALAGYGDDHGSTTAAAAAGVPVPAPPVKSSPAPQTAPSVPVPGATPPAGPVDDSALPALVPEVASVTQVMGAGQLEVMPKLNGPGMFTDQTNPPQCTGVVVPAARVAYDPAGPRATFVQALRDADENQLHTVFDGVTTFSTESAATAFVSQQAATWQGCRVGPIVLSLKDNKPLPWTVQDVALRGDILTATVAPQNGSGTCQRAVTAKRNVVIDVMTCSDNAGAAATTLASRIVQRLGQST